MPPTAPPKSATGLQRSRRRVKWAILICIGPSTDKSTFRPTLSKRAVERLLLLEETGNKYHSKIDPNFHSFKNITSNRNTSRQIQKHHVKYKNLTSNTKTSCQIQKPHVKFKNITLDRNTSHQIQKHHVKYKNLTSNRKTSRQIQKHHVKKRIHTSKRKPHVK